jgi:Peptidase family M1 domain
MKNFLSICLMSLACHVVAQRSEPQPQARWQQRVEYTMNVDFDAKKHQFKGNQRLIYYNNSSEVLRKAYYHLYFNAFQPNSAMDVRSRNIADPDPRVADRISKLKPDEIGRQEVKTLTMDGKPCKFKVEGTILEVELPTMMPPASRAVFEMTFEGQVPMQIRRSGRNNKEGIDYTMTQWYPKMCQFDEQGWHANPYIGREFYGIWGLYDVTIKMDEKYTIAATGLLQNPTEIGKGYAASDAKVTPKVEKGKLTWHFKADNVHDFAWSADPDYTHTQLKADDGTQLHFFYQKGDKTESWEALPKIMGKVFQYVADNYGKYPFEAFSFVQGGDGGMEYPMLTMITGERPLNSLMGVSVHEALHNWYQGVLASNESLYGWMDEGFTSYVENDVEEWVRKQGWIPGVAAKGYDAMKDNVAAYCRFSQSGREEPLSIHADHYMTNTAYSIGAYVKGSVFLQELKYIVGEKMFKEAFKQYFNQWKFQHPNPNDVIRVFERMSDLELDWFKEYWVNSTHTIDYTIDKVESDVDKKTKVRLSRTGQMPMPLDIVVTYENGTQEMFYIPLDIMRGEKQPEDSKMKFNLLPDWTWTHPTYEFSIPEKYSKVKTIQMDPSGRLADVRLDDNIWNRPASTNDKK